MNKLIFKDFQKKLLYSDKRNVLLIENESGYMPLLFESNIYIDNCISTTVTVSFEYKTNIDDTYKTRMTSVQFNYRPVPVQMYLTVNSQHLYIRNFKVQFIYNGKVYETDQDLFRDFNCLSLYTDSDASEYKFFIDTVIGRIDEDNYNSINNPLMIETIIDGYIHVMPHKDSETEDTEMPFIYYKINDGDYDKLYEENLDDDAIVDLIDGNGNFEDDNPYNDYHHYIIPINAGDTIYLCSPGLDKTVLVYFSANREEERWD